MRFATALLLAPVMLAAAPAFSGKEVLYGPAPDWADVLSTDTIDISAKTPIARMDVQQRIEDGTVTIYMDRAVKLDSAEALTQGGTSTATWMPEKGDLTIHAVRILRGGGTVDVLSSGERYTVLRREPQLERRTLDGMLTATMPIPGLRIGDVLNIVYSQTVRDETLAGGAQLNPVLLAKPIEAGLAPDAVSWPANPSIVWDAGADPALDSRALAWLTMGQPDKARADAEAALASAPDSYMTRYLLGFAQRRLGDRSGEDVIAYIARIWPGVAQDYAHYGLRP